MKMLIIIISLLIGINLSAQQGVIKETTVAAGLGYNTSFGVAPNAHLNFKLINNLLLRAQFINGTSKASAAPNGMTNKVPKDEIFTGGINVGYALKLGNSNRNSLNLLAGISKVYLKQHSNFTKIENDYLEYGNNTSVNTLIILPLNLLTSLKNEYTYKKNIVDTFALTFTPELDIKLNKLIGIGFNSTLYLNQNKSMSDLNMFMKLRL